MNKRKMITAISVLAICGSIFAGCSKAPSASETSAPSSTPAANASATPEAITKTVTPEKELVVAGNGATVEKLMKDVVFKKFNEKYPDVKLSYVSGVSTELVAKVKAQKGSPQIDLTVVEGGEQEAGRAEGLWDRVNIQDIPNMAKVDPSLKVKDDSGVAVNFTPMGISYNAETVKAKGLPIPESWNDLTKPELKGNITMTEISSNFGRSATIMLAYANGGSEKSMDAGFEKLKIIAGYLPTFAKNASQLQQNLQDKTAAYTTWTMARSIVQKQESGLPLEFIIPKEGSNLVPNVATLVKGAPHPVAANLFIDFLLSEEVQTMYATKLYYNPAVNVKLPGDIAKLLEFDRSKVKNFDYEVLSQSMKEWLSRFNKEVAPLVGKN